MMVVGGWDAWGNGTAHTLYIANAEYQTIIFPRAERDLWETQIRLDAQFIVDLVFEMFWIP